MCRPQLVEIGARRLAHVEVAERSMQVAHGPGDERPRANPRRLADVDGASEAHAAHLDGQARLLARALPARAGGADPRPADELV